MSRHIADVIESQNGMPISGTPFLKAYRYERETKGEQTMSFFPNISAMSNLSSSLSFQLRQVAILTGGDLEIATTQAGLNAPIAQKADSVPLPVMQSMTPGLSGMMTSGGMDTFSKQGGLYSALLPYGMSVMPPTPAPAPAGPPAMTQTPPAETLAPVPTPTEPPASTPTAGTNPAEPSAPVQAPTTPPASGSAPEKPPVAAGPVPNESPTGGAAPMTPGPTPASLTTTGGTSPASGPSLSSLFPGISDGGTSNPFTLTLPLPLFQQMLFDPKSGIQLPGQQPTIKPTADTSGIPSKKESWPRPLAAPDVIAYVEDLVSGTFAKDGLIGKGDLQAAQELATSRQVKAQLKELFDYFGIVERNNPDNLVDAAAIADYYSRYPVV